MTLPVPLRPRLGLVLGTAVIGSRIPEDESFRILDSYIEAGGDMLDTANIYASWLPGCEGSSELTVGRWLKSRDVRSRIQICTKGGHPLLGGNVSRIRREALEQDLAQSLERLHVEKIDLYWLHRDDPTVAVEEIFGWIQPWLRSGLVGAVGCSNWQLGRIREALEVAARLGCAGFVASQVRWSLAELPALQPGGVVMDDAMRRWHVASRLPVFAYSAQANGYFAGKDLPQLMNPGNRLRRAAAEAVAARIGATPTQVALAWLRQQPFPVFPVIGPSSQWQLRESLGAVSYTLTETEMTELG